MGKYDKDRFQKELAINYCLAQRMIPFPEVIVRSVSDLSDSVELLTDIDVLGIKAVVDGGMNKVLFDCKTTNKLSSVNRAFWAAGVKSYVRADEAYVILKNRAVHNHRMSALTLGVDLHDEDSFKDLGKTLDVGFPSDTFYQSSIDRWNSVFDVYGKYVWAENIFDINRNVVPLTLNASNTFRRLIAEVRNIRGHVDPNKREHLAIVFDTLASMFVLWAVLARDIRRFYEPSISKSQFEKVLKYYIWGGKDAYNIRMQMHAKAGFDNGATLEFPGWPSLTTFVGLIVSAPQNMIECAHICRELAFRYVTGATPGFDKAIEKRMDDNARVRQFSISLAGYMVEAGQLPRDILKAVEGTILGF